MEQLRQIMDSHGAQEASELKLATRVITDETHFFHFEEPRCKAILATPQWVYSSVKAGIKQPAQYYSADPAMFFSSAVVSVIGFSPAYADLVRTVVTKYGGQWAATLTEDVTHLIADTAHSTPPAHLHPIIVPHAWFRDSFKLESLQDTSPYENGTRRATPAHRASAAAQQKVRRAPMERHPLPLPFIPFEIIAKIFLMCRNLALDKLSGYVEVLLNLSQVSQRWRTIARDTGPLWTHIFLDFHTKKSYNRRLKLAENVWIARSGSHPLSVNIRSYYPSSPNPAIAFLVAHNSRIRHLTLHLPATHFHAFFQIAAKSFPVLETVTLSVIPKSNTFFYPDLGMTRSEFFAEDFPSAEPDTGLLWGDLSSPASVFKNAVNLRSVTIDAVCADIDPHVLRLPWSILTDIDISSVAMGVRDTRDILPLLVNLINFSFATSSWQGHIMAPLTTLKLPIQQMNWCGPDVVETSIFFPLKLPRLTSLEMRDGSQPTLLILQTHSSFALQELRLIFFQLSFPVFSKFLREMPSLATLELRLSVALTDELMEFLTYDERKPVLPNLADLDLFDRHKYFSERAMMRMVESRWRAAPSGAPLLQRVRISTQTQPNPIFASRGIVPVGLAVVPLAPPSARRRVLERIAEMNEEGLSFQHEIVI